MSETPSGYELSRDWFEWSFENMDLINPTHSALLFFMIEHRNKLGGQQKFGLPRDMAKSAIGIKNNRTYTKAFEDLVEWGFVKVVEKSKNQHSANIISLVKNRKSKTKCYQNAINNFINSEESAYVKNTPAHTPATTPADTSATHGHIHQQVPEQVLEQRTGTAPIIKPINLKTYKPIIGNLAIPLEKFIEMRKKMKKPPTDEAIRLIILELEKLAPGDEATQIEILNQSTKNGWTDVYQLKTQKNGSKEKQPVYQNPDFKKYENQQIFPTHELKK